MDEKEKVTAAEETETAEPAKKPKKSKKNEEIEKLEAALAEKHDLLLRTAAEFDNYKKRTERERISTAEYSKASVIKTLLPIIDNIDRAAKAEAGSPEYIKGIEMIVKQFEGIASNLGIVEIASEGDVFNPELHEAVMHIEDESLGENVIVSTFASADGKAAFIRKDGNDTVLVAYSNGEVADVCEGASEILLLK